MAIFLGSLLGATSLRNSLNLLNVLVAEVRVGLVGLVPDVAVDGCRLEFEAFFLLCTKIRSGCLLGFRDFPGGCSGVAFCPVMVK